MSGYSEIWEEEHKDKIETEKKADACRKKLSEKCSTDIMVRLIFMNMCKDLSDHEIIEVYKTVFPEGETAEDSDLISRKALMEEINSLQVSITGLRAGKGVLHKFMEEYKKSVLKLVSEAPEAHGTKAKCENKYGLTKQEIYLMKHCIGLDNKKAYTRHGKKYYKPYRNRFYAPMNNDLWIGIQNKGYADFSGDPENLNGIYFLTRKGLDALGDSIGIYIYDEVD